MEYLKPNGQRAKNIITLIFIVLGLEVASLISNYFEFKMLQTAAKVGELDYQQAMANDMRVEILSITYLFAIIISGFFFILWFRRAYYNIGHKAGLTSQPDHWVVGCWFVPVLNLYMPYRLMKEMYQMTIDLLNRNGLSSSPPLTTKLVGWWWALYLGNAVMNQISLQASFGAETIEELSVSTTAHLFGNLIGIPFAVVTIKMIKDYVKIEPLLFEIKEEDDTMYVAEVDPAI